ncbi:MAG: 4Fe-4S binding protein, partial [Planctomycetes bacterium]|nr:4Fe-4S binding protein [Planctomycetota bacterium]
AARALAGLLEPDGGDPETRFAADLRDDPGAAAEARQVRIATEGAGALDPLDLEGYARAGGLEALRGCLAAGAPADAIAAVEASGLRGRGGAGFPTGRKWRAVREAPGGPKTVVANGDEGDPGAFMDRMILESFPFRVLEGAAIAALAVGAPEVVLYVRSEYPLALRRLREAVRILEDRGVLRPPGAGPEHASPSPSSPSAPLPRAPVSARVVEGAGAFVCGEETALLAALEGRRGHPRFRPPYPSEWGLGGRPTLVNNVETLALVPWILRRGPAAFKALGTAGSPGTKTFALAGKVRRGGLIEVPMGMTLREIVEGIGGGCRDGKRLKAVQVGGPSGGCVPFFLADTPVDYEALLSAGAFMGSGGMVVLDEDDCMVDVARYFLRFTQAESCGKCPPCRAGTKRMLEILDRLCEGTGAPADVEDLGRLAAAVRRGSLCGLGRSAPNPVLSVLRHFRDEVEAHTRGVCPAGRCRSLIRYAVSEDCIGCTRCAQHCPTDAIAMRPYERHEIDPAKCIRCGTCAQVCPQNAVKVERPGSKAPFPVS